MKNIIVLFLFILGFEYALAGGKGEACTLVSQQIVHRGELRLRNNSTVSYRAVKYLTECETVAFSGIYIESDEIPASLLPDHQDMKDLVFAKGSAARKQFESGTRINTHGIIARGTVANGPLKLLLTVLEFRNTPGDFSGEYWFSVVGEVVPAQNIKFEIP